VPDHRERLQNGLADRYQLERELGEGGMATVYLARDLRHDRLVALKVLRPDLAATLGPERFVREIRTAARLEHAHILPVHDSGEAAGLLWYTMPYVQGESLRDRMRREVQLPMEEAVRLTREVAEALDYAHAEGIVHRDVKPENILLSGGHARVADFGLAKAVSVAGGEQLTGTGLVVGTPAYMSPEQAAADRGLDPRTDVYSLGCVLYEMLAGEPPFTGPTAQAIIAKRLGGEVPGVRRTRPAVPEVVERAITKALAPLPADRWSSASDFAHALAAPPAAPPAATTAKTVAGPPQAQPASTRSRRTTILSGAVLLLAALAGVLWQRTRAGGGPNAHDGVASGPERLAVLPFENLGDSTDEYFADGVTDAVRGKLTALRGLQVIARSSSRQYKNTTKSPQQIGRELEVRYVLTGTVRWENTAGRPGRVQVTPELIEVAPAAARWQQPFDAPLTDVFQVQADIAGRVAEALGVALGTGERNALTERPTTDIAAYDAYLKGEEISVGLSTADPVALLRATNYYDQAVALDSAFALAWVQLSRANSLLFFRGKASSSTMDRALQAAERALALAPERPETYLALGDYHANISREYAEALEQYARGRRLAPASADLLTSTALVEQRLGRWDSALEHLNQARRLDPRSAFTARRFAFTLLWLRRYPEAHTAYDRALALDPANIAALEHRAMLFAMQADLSRARAALRSAPREVEPAALVAYVAGYWDLVWLLDEEQRALLLRLTPGPFGEDRGSWGLALAQAHALRGDGSRARAYADSARAALEAQPRDARDEADFRMYRAIALAYLGRRAEAVREGERGVAARPISKDAYNGAYNQHLLAQVYILVGQHEKALDQLEPLLKIPYFLSPGWLKIDPTFDPLRGNPRFERLVKGTLAP
jgi:eukaryotic-like serine/threonine-protein kinase